jgi:tetratricopeptide (TPR) repeat protein
MPVTPLEMFISYAHKDEEMRDKLEKRLDSLRRQGLISQWHDRQIPAGAEWAATIDTHLDTASVILLLISPDFMASTYCYDIEMKRALERHQAREACVIPIILRPTEWHDAPFARLQALPSQGKPITTWNNQDEAFFDITRGIRRAIEVWTTPTSSIQIASEQIWNIPYQRNQFFTGQEVILSSLREMLEKNIIAALTQPQAISGLGGIGKTQIAVEFAFRYHDEYRAVLWARADSRESLFQDFVVIATLLHLPEKDEQDQNITVEAVKRWLDTHDQWLLILDNVDNVSLIHNVLPSEANGHILLTTRSQLLGTIAQNVKVEHLGLEDGTLFLLKRAGLLALNATLGQVAVAPDRAAAEKLVQALDGLPLALDQAGAYINETGCGVSGYLERYHVYRARLLKKRGTMVTDYPETVATTWSLSFEKVYEINPVATELLNFCAFLHPDAIPEELITEGAPYLGPKLRTLASDLIAFDEVMEALRAYSLIQRNPDTKTLSMHRLVQAVLIDNLNDEQQRQWAERVVYTVNQLFPSVEFARWPQCERYLLHAQACAALIEAWNLTFLEAARLLNDAATYLQARGRYAEAEPLLQRALAISEQQLGTDHPDTATSLNDLAELYRNQGRYEEAEPLMQRALAIREKQLGQDHPHTATSLDNLAALYQAQGKYAEAEPLYDCAHVA